MIQARPAFIRNLMTGEEPPKAANTNTDWLAMP
jgi:hypothetical protein